MYFYIGWESLLQCYTKLHTNKNNIFTNLISRLSPSVSNLHQWKYRWAGGLCGVTHIIHRDYKVIVQPFLLSNMYFVKLLILSPSPESSFDRKF